MKKNTSSSFKTAAKCMYAALAILKKNDGVMSSRDLMNEVGKTVELSDWELDKSTTGRVRWQAIYQFSSIDYVKAGFLLKKNGNWCLTPEGENLLNKSPEEVHSIAQEEYRKWLKNNADQNIKDIDQVEEEIEKEPFSIEELEEQALNGIKDFIRKKGPYEFQELVAALLRAMDYHTPFVAPKGKDGGIDIIAYIDPLGAQTPRIKVQVKHYPDTPIAAKDIRSLAGILRDGDIGLFVTSGTYSPDAKNTALTSKEYLKLIDGSEFITLWQQYYNKMSDEDKNLLPIKRIAFLGSNE